MWAEFDGDLDIPLGSMQRCSQRPQWVAVGHGGTAVERRHHPPSSPLIPSGVDTGSPMGPSLPLLRMLGIPQLDVQAGLMD